MKWRISGVAEAVSFLRRSVIHGEVEVVSEHTTKEYGFVEEEV
jgi:hypothetical protein